MLSIKLEEIRLNSAKNQNIFFGGGDENRGYFFLLWPY